MLLVDEVSNALGDRKEEVFTTPLLEKKLLTKDVDKSTNESAYMKKVVFKIRRKGLDKFEGHSIGYTGWFKLDSGFFLNNIFYGLFRILLKTVYKEY